MWCDDFDMDLPKVVPEARQALGKIGDLEIATYGGVTGGKLNHPSVWNHERGMIAFFGRPGRIGKPAAYYTDKQPVPCTLWEALRDAWCHTYVILFEGVPIWDGEQAWRLFERLMWHTRGWKKLPDATALDLKVDVLDLVVETGAKVEQLVTPRAVLAGTSRDGDK